MAKKSDVKDTVDTTVVESVSVVSESLENEAKSGTLGNEKPSNGDTEPPKKKQRKKPGNAANLTPFRSVEEARARGKIGGVRSGEVRREKKLLRERMKDALLATAKNKDLKKVAQELGLPNEHNLDLLVARSLNSALNGSTKDAAKWAEMITKWSGLFVEETNANVAVVQSTELSIDQLKERLDDFNND